MAEQSPVQQLIQSLAGIQTTAQQNASNAANNGNPNTVYNTSAWGYGGPPVMDSNGAWSTNQFSPAAVLQAQNLNFGSWQAPAGTGSTTGGGWGNLRPVLPPNIADPNWVPTTPPGGGGTTTPPTTTPPTGGGGTPVTGGNGGVSDYPLWNGPGGGWSPPGGLQPGNTPTGGNNLNKPGTGPTSSIGQWLTTGQGGQLLGMNPDGTISWQQLVDLVSEPWVQGNLYMSNSGQWNPQNIVRALVNTIIPGGGNLLQTLASKGVFGETIKQWVIEGKFAEAENAMVGMMEELEAWDREDGTNHTGTNPQLGGNRGGVPYVPGIGLDNIKGPGAGIKSPGSLVKNPNGPTNSRDKSPGSNDKAPSSSSNAGSAGSLQDALNSASIYWWLDGTRQQSVDAMRRMFENQEK